jgi:hypothetical protein
MEELETGLSILSKKNKFEREKGRRDIYFRQIDWDSGRDVQEITKSLKNN